MGYPRLSCGHAQPSAVDLLPWPCRCQRELDESADWQTQQTSQLGKIEVLFIHIDDGPEHHSIDCLKVMEVEK